MTKQAHSKDAYANPNPSNAFVTDDLKVKEAAAAKDATLSKARQLLAEAADIFNDANGRDKEAKECANRAALELYNLRVTGKASKDEATAVLRDIFGAKMKPDGITPSTTPLGKGEDIRKRVVRLVEAHNYVIGQPDTGFFDGTDPEDVNRVLQDYLNPEGDTTLWTSYEALAKIKSEAHETLEMAFDHRKVTAMVNSLTPAASAEKIWQTPALRTAYAALFGTIQAIGITLTELDKLAAEAKPEGFTDELVKAPAETKDVGGQTESVAA